MAGIISIELAGTPKGKQRPRFVRATGHAYTPQATRSYEDALRYAGQVQMAGRAPISGPLAVTVSAYLPIPESWSRKKKREALAGSLLPAKKPDWDNYIKTLDALNQVVWQDDCQIVEGVFAKRYSERPRLIITVEQVHNTGDAA